MNKYEELKKKQSNEFNKFPIAFAFSDEQLKEGLKKLGLNENDTDKVVGLGNGGFIKKTDIENYKKLSEKFYKEFKEAIAEDKTGENFIKDMFEYELANHEYGYTFEINDTLEAIGITLDEIDNSDNLRKGLDLALEKYIHIENTQETEDEEEDEIWKLEIYLKTKKLKRIYLFKMKKKREKNMK